MPDDEDKKDASPEPPKEVKVEDKVEKEEKDPLPDFGTPLKAPKPDNVVEKNGEDD